MKDAKKNEMAGGDVAAAVRQRRAKMKKNPVAKTRTKEGLRKAIQIVDGAKRQAKRDNAWIKKAGKSGLNPFGVSRLVLNRDAKKNDAADLAVRKFRGQD